MRQMELEREMRMRGIKPVGERTVVALALSAEESMAIGQVHRKKRDLK